MQARKAMRQNATRIARTLIVGLSIYTGVCAGQVDTTELRTTRPLKDNWQFVQDDNLTPQEALASAGAGWQVVSLPHTWNATDAASLDAENYERGQGWYRLTFATPTAGVRHWLEIGAASLVADVWLNGQRLGQHKGGFTAFRFDITNQLSPSGSNVLLVRADNSQPNAEDDLTAIAPLGGDFNVSGGLYRYVSLISLNDSAHFDLGDLGGPGVYATTTSISEAAATVNVRAKLKNDSATAGDYVVRLSLLDAGGQLAATGEQTVTLQPGGSSEAVQDLSVASPHVWQGVADPYQYRLVAELLTSAAAPVDKVVQSVGIRQMRFDPNEGFFLNGQRVRLNGVAMHQDFLGKAWAIADEDLEASLALIMEMGANAIRLGHYPFSQRALARISELGLIAWAEAPVGLGTTVESCASYDASDEYVSNARQQLQEMIRQQYNHAAIAMWAVGNESSARQLGCDEPHDNVTPVIGELHTLAKQEDPTRPTVYAEFDENIGRPLPFATGGITDLLGTNRYYYWYDLAIEEFQPLLGLMRQRYPNQPLAISEYGAGAAITHHSDNPLGGPPEVRSAPEGQVTYQPEEYASYVHEQNWRVISGTPFLWGSFVWNMFDFGSAHRNEGDVLGVNTKGLVTFDRQTRKDPFYFYKANWSTQPVTYIAGRRHTDRAYAVTEIKVYSNADSVELTVNGASVGVMAAAQCEQRTCVFPDVRLSPGVNTVTATGIHAGKPVSDSVEWSFNTSDVNIQAGRVATGYVASNGASFGSDDFFSGGAAGSTDSGDVDGGVPEDIRGSDDPFLYKFYRSGDFSYDIPLSDGNYEVTLGFIEPDVDADVGDRVFNIDANGQSLLESFDVLQEAGEPRTAITRVFRVQVSGGRLVLDFDPVEGEAVVSNIHISAGAATTPTRGPP